jgi:hypothetical protein
MTLAANFTFSIPVFSHFSYDANSGEMHSFNLEINNYQTKKLWNLGLTLFHLSC